MAVATSMAAVDTSESRLKENVAMSSDADDQKSATKKSVAHEATMLVTIVSILFWYAFNGATVILNRYIFMEAFGFKFPLTLTFLHMLSGFVLSIACFKTRVLPMQMLPLSITVYTKERLIFALLFVGNIILGNVALRFIPVSFMQTVKSGVPFFVCLFSFALFGVRYTAQTLLSMIPVVFGVCLASLNELSFDMRGFIAVLAACFVQALQIVFASRLLRSSPEDEAAARASELESQSSDQQASKVVVNTEKLDAFNTVILVAPPALVFLSPLILTTELYPLMNWLSVKGSFELFVLIGSCLIAFALNLSSFWLLKVVTGVTYATAGNFKVVVVIIVSVMIFKNPISGQAAMGCIITVLGCFWYASIKNRTIES
ncbi:GDP-mannose transporter GONST5 [Porphyridium purpureum]|uniref:GDP-mannose transporter GONST5 n=1 Tax=Porphyridium purpureum TaxID=35688 RepID=A0A5J4YVP4_PORPP|nr:GDP-mannose transporter GONST5 [Porphyridium purpureum]|eukprot:POR3912..scf209_3